MTGFLAKACGFKEISDYSVDPEVAVTMQDAKEAILGAEEFVISVEAALT